MTEITQYVRLFVIYNYEWAVSNIQHETRPSYALDMMGTN